MVTRSTPIWPAIFLFLNVLPGSWRPPVEPCERCEIDTPCEARRPPKFQRFIGAGKTLAHRRAGDIDELAGNEVVGGDLGADRDHSSASTRNSASFIFGSTFATAKRPRSAFETFFTLALPDAELHGGVAVLLLRAVRDYLAAVELAGR